MDVLSIMDGLLRDSNRLWKFIRDWRYNENIFLPYSTTPKRHPGSGGKRDTEQEIRFAYILCFVDHCIHLLPILDRRYWTLLRRGYTHGKACWKAYAERKEKSDIARRLLITLRGEWDSDKVN